MRIPLPGLGASAYILDRERGQRGTQVFRRGARAPNALDHTW
jgi:hypothetical protein